MKQETLKQKMFRIWKQNESNDTIDIIPTKPEDDTIDIINEPDTDTINVI